MWSGAAIVARDLERERLEELEGLDVRAHVDPAPHRTPLPHAKHPVRLPLLQLERGVLAADQLETSNPRADKTIQRCDNQYLGAKARIGN